MTPWLAAFISLHFCPPLVSSYQLTHLLACCACLLLVAPKWRHSWTLPSAYFAAWLAFAVIGGCFQPGWYWHIYGDYLRYEGAATWVLLTVMAALYWQLKRNTAWLELACVMVLLLQTAAILYRWDGADFIMGETKIAVAAFACVAGALLYAAHPAMLLFAAVPLAWGCNRGALAAVCVGIVVYHAFTANTRLEWRKIACIAAILTALSIPLTQKLLSTSVTGYGPRSQWMLQASAIASGCPVAGFGFDTQIDYLNNPVGPASEAKAHPGSTYKSDRCHNIAFDTILQTGWVGYTLLLLSLGAAIGTVILHKTGKNCALLAAVAAFVTFSLFNPAGTPSLGLAICCLFGIRKDQTLPAAPVPLHQRLCPLETLSPLALRRDAPHQRI